MDKKKHSMTGWAKRDTERLTEWAKRDIEMLTVWAKRDIGKKKHRWAEKLGKKAET